MVPTLTKVYSGNNDERILAKFKKKIKNYETYLNDFGNLNYKSYLPQIIRSDLF